MSAVTVSGLPGGLPAMLEDPAAAHQIIHRTVEGGSRIAVSCPCLRPAGRQRFRRGQWIEARTRWLPGEAEAAWTAWHENQGEEKAS